MKLLTRDAFREQVFQRDNHTCVFCDKPAGDAHHIIERRLWPDGGYYLNNGASVCEEHHLACERTTISVEQVREACGITKKIVPPHLYDDHVYDKWGNPILENRRRLRGDLFYDSSVQKALGEGGVLGDFVQMAIITCEFQLGYAGWFSDEELSSIEKLFKKGVQSHKAIKSYTIGFVPMGDRESFYKEGAVIHTNLGKVFRDVPTLDYFIVDLSLLGNIQALVLTEIAIKDRLLFIEKSDGKVVNLASLPTLKGGRFTSRNAPSL